MSNYSGSKLDRWIEDMRHDFGFPAGYDTKGLYSADEGEKRKAALALYDTLNNRRVDEKHVHLESRETDKVTYIVNGRGYVVAMLKKKPSGILLDGESKEYVTFFGGRGEWGGIADRLDNGVYHDKT